MGRRAKLAVAKLLLAAREFCIAQGCARILSTQELQPGLHTNRLGLCQVVEFYGPSWQNPTACMLYQLHPYHSGWSILSYAFKLIMTMATCTYSYPVLGAPKGRFFLGLQGPLHLATSIVRVGTRFIMRPPLRSLLLRRFYSVVEGFRGAVGVCGGFQE